MEYGKFGRATITARQDALHRYQFGLKTAEFLLCRNCGAYVAAYFEHAGQGYATLNTNSFDDRAAFGQPAKSADYDAETPDSRVARRLERWTPTTFVERGERP